MYDTLANLLIQGNYGKAGVLYVSVLIITLIFLYNAHRLAIVVYRSKKSKVTVVLFVAVASIFFIAMLIGPDLYKVIGEHYA